jgi:release factor glutamine methyltransferase
LKEKPSTPLCELLDDARERLDSRLEAELLAAFLLGRDRGWLYAHDDEPIGAGTRARFEALLERRLAGQPIAYILGQREFYGRSFLVDDSVLIPRPETELLIDTALTLALPERPRVADIGTGSGCIALTLAAERPNWSVTATDVSEQALVVARHNRARLGLADVAMRRGDLFEPLATERFDLIVANPPYVAHGDPHLEVGDVRFEPETALVAGRDGSRILRRLIAAAGSHLEPRGWLLVEHGHDQADRVRDLYSRAGFAAVESRRDLAGIERVTLGRRD